MDAAPTLRRHRDGQPARLSKPTGLSAWAQNIRSRDAMTITPTRQHPRHIGSMCGPLRRVAIDSDRWRCPQGNAGSLRSLLGREAERFGVGPAVVLGQDLTEAAGPVSDGAVADLATGDRQLGNGHRKAAGRRLAHLHL
jgi:hypothetical protein